MVAEGDPAPDFTATDCDGASFRLSAVTPGRPVVLYFYPRSFTPGCTAQACAFRDAAADFGTLDAEIVGISGDAAHAAFKAAHRLPFRLISDANGALRSLYAVPSTLWVLPGRVTYVVDARGVVVRVISAALDVAAHVKGAREALEALRAGAPAAE
ncbi:hypothetical protein I4F81_012590 [Pyropia yezoensis]|uniref:Uncharacterized protein n=1 Tax=Pyropia yezoensis TaxID=2788 RepID=A0ACC3CJ50_PYRYE|nr:hypothetical protein I4F81_012590 [Neopyropia yezoensis]